MDLKILEETPPWEWPDGAGKMLFDVVTDHQADAGDRILAAELAGDITVIDDDIAEALLHILQDSSEPEALRGQSAIALGPVLDLADMDGFDDPDDVPISEEMFGNIQESFRRLYLDAAVPKNVRRRILEASVRAPQDWHRDAIRAAYASADEDWQLTAIFSMRWVRGFKKQFLEALESSNPEIHYQAVCAAGNWELDAAWPHVSSLLREPVNNKPLLLAAIDAAAAIRPQKARSILMDLTQSDDEDIADAAEEALGMARDDFDDDGYFT
ncbi:MAG: hypothetical protein K9K88_13640 [Desulfobacterales bacterium]|nr:hypothetical protein [Desulfobacterales bacterium]